MEVKRSKIQENQNPRTGGRRNRGKICLRQSRGFQRSPAFSQEWTLQQIALTEERSPTGNITQIHTQYNNIHKAIQDFYAELYKKRTAMTTFFLSKTSLETHLTLSITEKEALVAEAPLTHKDEGTLINSLCLNKAIRTTGVTAGFYNFFWKLVPYTITKVVNNILDKGLIPSNQRQGTRVSIPEEGKDPKYISNLKPITLLTALHKLVSRSVICRQKLGLDKRVKPWHMAYYSGHNHPQCLWHLPVCLRAQQTRLHSYCGFLQSI